MSSATDIIDVRAQSPCGTNFGDGDNGIPAVIISGLSKPTHQRTLPTLLLYSETGLRIYDELTTKAAEYYLFAAEEEILKKHGDEIIRAMHSRGFVESESVVELGAGQSPLTLLNRSLRKTSHILLALSRLVDEERSTPLITYYALDLEKPELERTLSELATSDIGSKLQGKVTTKGMWGTYDGGLSFIQEGGIRGRDAVSRILTEGLTFENLKDMSPVSYRDSDSTGTRSSESAPDSDVTTNPSTPDVPQTPLHILFLGSSLGNFHRGDDANFLRGLPLRPGSGDTLLLGLDHDNDSAEVERAYNDSLGITRKFIMQGLKAAGAALGDETLFGEDKWDYVGKYNQEQRRHEGYYISKANQTVCTPSGEQFEFLAEELINVEYSHKFSEQDTFTLFTNANLRPIQRWMDPTSRYSLWLLERAPFTFPLLKSPDGVAYPNAFSVPSIAEWETIWSAWDMITMGMISPHLLYEKPIDLRHICLFYLGHIPTFLDMHLSKLFGEPRTEPENFRIVFERGIDPNVDDPTQCHPHSEVPQNNEGWPTLSSILGFKSRVRQRLLKVYSDIASGKIEMTRKVGRVLFMTWEHEAFHSETMLYMLLRTVGQGTLLPSGFTPPPWGALADGWDKAPLPPSSTVTLGPESITLGHDDSEDDDASKEVEDHEFGWDNEQPQRQADVGKFRIEWRPVSNGDFYEFYNSGGSDKVAFPKSWCMIDDEVYVLTMYGPVPMRIARLWPVMTTYDDLSAYAIVKGGRIPTDPELRLFLDKFECGYEGGANIGFRNLHAVPATTGIPGKGGKGHNGGVWEWTSTLFDSYEGFKPSKIYPEYSRDFFDSKHHVVIGGSCVTVPRQANRRTMRNYYQHNYPYAWVGARVAYDV
ncbi:DUF323 domain-containing protein [Thelephora ganbajun]|uniref:DUF323 domain-containing protein n=1 Tax=Thelephora ganbajun TaxID=370292 RepID=A0ACB6Z9G7_THEGA|nr:DUF323 domain-containing protein [Thelephora ganbajun]